MDKHGDFFPENPQNTEELIGCWRNAQRRRNSSTRSPQQRAELDQLSQQAFGSPELMSQLAQMDSALRQAQPGLGWDESSDFSGGQGMGLGRRAAALHDIGELSTPSVSNCPNGIRVQVSTTSTSKR